MIKLESKVKISVMIYFGYKDERHRFDHQRTDEVRSIK